ncbi:DUF6343 family protein [Kitasatospora sp. NPDC048365]|uniref:DUF6343 family protein n=1 Tax=Kitasatospora sp. NPDC048365 TaxID=3364050 RepID=UPI003710DACC
MAVQRRPGARHSPGRAGERHDFPQGPSGPGRTTPELRPQDEVRQGDEPVTARSDLELRRLLSRVFLGLFVCGTAAFAVLAAFSGDGPAPNRSTFEVFAAVCAAFAGIAVIDLTVIRRRLAAGQGRRPERR